MSLEDNERFDSSNIEKTKEELKKENPNIPCNIWGYIKNLEARILQLEGK